MMEGAGVGSLRGFEIRSDLDGLGVRCLRPPPSILSDTWVSGLYQSPAKTPSP